MQTSSNRRLWLSAIRWYHRWHLRRLLRGTNSIIIEIKLDVIAFEILHGSELLDKQKKKN